MDFKTPFLFPPKGEGFEKIFKQTGFEKQP